MLPRPALAVSAALAVVVLGGASSVANAVPAKVERRWSAVRDYGSPLAALPGGGVVAGTRTGFMAFDARGRRLWNRRVQAFPSDGYPLTPRVGVIARGVLWVSGLRVERANGRFRFSRAEGCLPGSVWTGFSPTMRLERCLADGGWQATQLPVEWREPGERGFPAIVAPTGDAIEGIDAGQVIRPSGGVAPAYLVAVGPSGAIRWRSRMDFASTFWTLAADARRVYSVVGSPTRPFALTAVAWSADDGTRLWFRTVWGTEIVADPSGRLIAADTTGAVAFDRDGNRRWHVEMAAPFRPVAVTDGAVVGAVSARDETTGERVVVAIDVRSGRRRWTYRSRAPIASIATTGRRVYVSSSDGRITALSIEGRAR